MMARWKKCIREQKKIISLVDYVVAIHFWQLDKCSRIYRNHSQLYYLLHIIYILNFIPWGSYTSPSREWLNLLSLSFGLMIFLLLLLLVVLLLYRIIYNTHIKNKNKSFRQFLRQKKNKFRNLYMKGTPTFICC